MYKTSLVYTDRKTKADYVYDKYKSLFGKSVLDVGADAMYLKPSIVKGGGNYVGMGYGSGIDIEANLENLPYPFKDKQFDTVLCLDVLEHLENVHSVFDELCRVASKNIVIALPNPWSDFFTVLRTGDYSSQEKVKFYGLPADRPTDRHRWFFSEQDGRDFIVARAQMNGWRLVQCDAIGDNKPFGGRGVKGFLGRILLRLIFRSDIDKLGLHHGASWFVLERS